MFRSLTLAAVFACVTIPAIAQPALDRDMRHDTCLRHRNIYDYQLVPGNRSLIVTDLSRQRYRLNFMGRCYNLQHQFGLAFKSRGVGTLSCIERGDEILMNDPVGPNQCIIQSVQLQTRDLDREDMDAIREQEDRKNHRRND